MPDAVVVREGDVLLPPWVVGVGVKKFATFATRERFVRRDEERRTISPVESDGTPKRIRIPFAWLNLNVETRHERRQEWHKIAHAVALKNATIGTRYTTVRPLFEHVN